MDNTSKGKVGIIGGGIMGISLGYFLAKQGVSVTIYEASPVLGGLAGPIILEDGTQVDRFYHAILSSDSHLRELCEELGIADQFRFKETKTSFYYKNALHPMNNMIDFLKFPPLGWIDRFRLGLTVLAAQFTKDWRTLESISVQDWLLKWGGKVTFQNIWRPMLKAKFDAGFDDVPATWIWSRLVRMKSTREGANQKEMAGHLIGGYITLIEALTEKIKEFGGEVLLKTPVKEIVIEDGRTTGIRMVDDEIVEYDKVICTMQTPIFQRLIPSADENYHAYLSKSDYLGIIAPLLVLDRPLTGNWTVNITDDRFPFTGVIETTAYIDPKYVGGYHLVYLPKYTAPGSEWQRKSDDEIKQIWLENLKEMFPDFDPSSIKYFLIHRERYVEPLHGLNETDLVPDVKTPVENLFLATTSQIYPALTNGESVSRHAREAADVVLES
ncbi:MAG: NAD(P)/FAD-dependent oxidoreductase [Anaerolineales bacterium]|nr:NAD(P)/FAD-dependent oxidoreductase [Anaerolineales bacterium]